MPADTVTPSAIESLMDKGFNLVHIQSGLRDQLDRALTAGGNFFRGDDTSKLQLRLPNDTGYRPYGVEYSLSPERPDKMESFTVRYGTNRECAKMPSGQVRDLCTAMCELKESMDQIAVAIFAALQTRYQQEADDCADHIARRSILQMNYSRPSQTTDHYINEVHEDGSLFTLAAVTSPGLELRTEDGSFEPITTAHDQLLIMPGEILWLLTGGQIRPCYHRVRTIPYLADRLSLLMFADIEPRTCRAWVDSEINAGVDIGKRVLTNSTRYGLAEWTDDIQNTSQ